MSTHFIASYRKSVPHRTAARCLQVLRESLVVMSVPMKCITSNYLITRRLDYTWIDASRKQVKLPAPTYIDYVMSWVQQTIDNGRDFPTKRTKDNSQILRSYFFYYLTD